MDLKDSGKGKVSFMYPTLCFYDNTDCPNKNANRTFGINNFKNYESI